MPHPVAYGVAWYRAESAFIREIIPRTSVVREKGGGEEGEIFLHRQHVRCGER